MEGENQTGDKVPGKVKKRKVNPNDPDALSEEDVGSDESLQPGESEGAVETQEDSEVKKKKSSVPDKPSLSDSRKLDESAVSQKKSKDVISSQELQPSSLQKEPSSKESSVTAPKEPASAKDLTASTPKESVSPKESVAATPKEPVSPKDSSGPTPKEPVSPKDSSGPTPKEPVSPKDSSGPTTKETVSPKESSGTTPKEPASGKNLTALTPKEPISPKESSGPTPKEPISPKESSGPTPKEPISPKESSGPTPKEPVSPKDSAPTPKEPVSPKDSAPTPKEPASPFSPKEPVSPKDSSPKEPAGAKEAASREPFSPKETAPTPKGLKSASKDLSGPKGSVLRDSKSLSKDPTLLSKDSKGTSNVTGLSRESKSAPKDATLPKEAVPPPQDHATGPKDITPEEKDKVPALPKPAGIGDKKPGEEDGKVPKKVEQPEKSEGVGQKGAPTDGTTECCPPPCVTLPCNIGGGNGIMSIVSNFPCGNYLGARVMLNKRNPFKHNPPAPDDNRGRVTNPSSLVDYIINLREDLADFQECHGLPRSRDYSFVSLGLALAQESVRAILSILCIFTELFPILAILSLILRFALDKLIDILQTTDSSQKIKKIVIFTIEMLIILIPLWLLVGIIFMPLITLIISVFRRLFHIKGGDAGEVCCIKSKPKPKPDDCP